MELICTLGKGSVIRKYKRALEIPVLAYWGHSPIYKDMKTLQGSKNASRLHKTKISQPISFVP